MASKDYLKLQQEAQRKKIEIAKKQQKQIKALYEDVYKDLAKKLEKANKDSLNERWIKDYQKSLKEEIRKLNNEIEGIIGKNMQQATNVAIGPDFSFFMLLDNKYNLDMKSTFSGMFSNIPKDAMNEILFGKVYKDRKGLSERIWQDIKKFDKDIDYIIAKGIAEKKSSYDIAKDLEMYVDPNSKKDWEWSKVYPKSSKKIDYNAQRLARTSVSHAFQQAQIRSCKKNPYVEGIKWLASNSHNRTCQLCKDRASQDNYNLGAGVYPVEDTPLDHPNGLCTTISHIPMSLEDIGAELRNWLDGEHNSKLDEWYSKYGEEFAGVNKNNSKAYDELAATKQNSNKKPKPSKKDFTTKKDTSLTLDGAETNYYIPKGEKVKNIEVIAGKGVKRDIDDINRLIREYTKSNGEITDKNEWQKIKGFVNATDGKINQKLEVHWYECKDIGKVEWKIKAR